MFVCARTYTRAEGFFLPNLAVYPNGYTERHSEPANALYDDFMNRF